jgi:hypothetical protein
MKKIKVQQSIKEEEIVVKVTQDITQIIAELPAVVEGLTGAELSRLIKKVPALAAAGNGTSEAE